MVLKRQAPAESTVVQEFNPRPFPSLLQIGEPAVDDESGRRGNARWVKSTNRPTILRRDPLFLSEWDEETANRLGKLRTEACAETIRILGLRVDFLKDSAGDRSTGDGRFDLRSAEEAQIAIDPPPHNKAYFEAHLEALSRYYDVQSNGALCIEYDVFPQEPDSVYHLGDTQRYGPWIFSVSSDTILARAERFVRESVMLADSLDQAIEWKEYNSFMVFHAGSDFQSDINQDTNYDIPSFNLFLGDSLEVYVDGPDSVMVNLVMVVPETVSQDDFIGALNGVMAHEFGHQLNFFDLYDVFTGLPAVGVFSLMDSGDGLFGTVGDPYNDGQVIAVRGILPTSLDPWHKLVFFPETMNIHDAQPEEVVDLPGILLNGDILRIPVHLSEYFLAETRVIDYNADGQVILRADSLTGVVLGPEPDEEMPDDNLARLEYDYLLPGNGGVVLWHIDEFAAITGLRSYGAVNVFSDRRGVDVEEADGIQDIGTASSEFSGGPYDPFFVGGFTRFGPSTVPDSRTNDGTETGIDLEVLDEPANSMRIALAVPDQLSGWPLIFDGAPPPNWLASVDIGGEGFEDILLAAGNSVLALDPDGGSFGQDGNWFLFATQPDTLDEGPVVSVDGAGLPTSPSPAVGIRSAGRARWYRPDLFYNDEAELLATWPGPQSRRAMTAGPVPVSRDNLWFLGNANGALEALTYADSLGTMLLTWSIDETSGGLADTVTAVAAGHVDSGAPLWISFGSIDGMVTLATVEEEGSQPNVLDGWPQSVGSGPVRDLLMLRAPVRQGESPTDLLLISAEDRTIDLRRFDGTSMPGWPKVVSDTLAGSPAIGDPDGDGLLEIVATTRAGEINIWELAGTDEPFWPQSVWHPDQMRRIECRTGPRLWDLSLDGTIEIVQLRGDGIILVLNGLGEAVDGWPQATGDPGFDGPMRLFGPDGQERWYISGAHLDTLSTISGLRVRVGSDLAEHSRGSFPQPGVDPGRGGVYPLALVPIPLEAIAFLDESELILHPNPVKGRDLKIRYVLGADAKVRGKIYDISGRCRAEADWQGNAGVSGETYEWDLSELASGTYVVRLEFEGPGERRRVTRSVALVR